jgi:hypothetical protein
MLWSHISPKSLTEIRMRKGPQECSLDKKDENRQDEPFLDTFHSLASIDELAKSRKPYLPVIPRFDRGIQGKQRFLDPVFQRGDDVGNFLRSRQVFFRTANRSAPQKHDPLCPFPAEGIGRFMLFSFCSLLLLLLHYSTIPALHYCSLS